MANHFFIPAIFSSLTGPLVLALIFLFVYFQQRKPFMGLWMLFWLTFLARSILGLANLTHGQEPNPFLVDHLPNIAGGIVLLWGTRLFMGRQMPRSWVTGFVLSTAWLLLGVMMGLPQRVLVVPTFAFLGVVYFRTGVDMLRYRELRGGGKFLAGIAFIAWALLKVFYLLYFPSQKPFNPWGYVLCLVVADTLAVGLLLSYFESLHQQLAESEERYRSLVANIPDITWTRDRKGTMVYVSAGIKRIMGAGNTLKATLLDGVHPHDRDRVERAWEALFEAEKPYDVEYRVKSPGGRWAWVHDRALKTYRRNGTAYSDGLLSNIDKRKETERILRRYERIVSTSQDLMFMLDANLVCLVANQAFAQACGRQHGDIAGKPLAQLLPDPDFYGKLRNRLAGCLKGKPLQWQTQVRLSANGERTLNIAAYPYREKTGAIAGIVVNGQDVTEIRELEERLQQARRLETISVLAGGVAHRFNNELAAIQGHVDLVKLSDGLTPDLDAHIVPITRSIQKMAGLTRKLLAYGRGGQYQPVSLDINEFLRENLPALTRNLPSDIRVNTRFDEPMPPIVADKRQLQLVFSELVNNAVEAMGTAGEMTIETLGELPTAYLQRHHPRVADGSYVGLTVTDTGRGMDPEVAERIFEPFFSTRFPGRGLGMSAVHGVVRNHGGDITVASVPDRGTTVRVCLAVRHRPPAYKPGPSVPSQKGRKTLLLVEDEPELVSVSSEILRAFNYRVLTAATGSEAVRIFSRRRADIDLILLDMKLPDMDGRQVFDRMREVQPDIKVIICSGYALNETIEAILASGAASFLQKPFSAVRLVEELELAL